MSEGVVVVTTTVADDATAVELSATLVQRRLAACVQRSPIRSTYRWEGEVHDEAEVLLCIKTTSARLAALEAALAELHPYEVPELLVTPASASAAYAAWVVGEVADRDA